MPRIALRCCFSKFLSKMVLTIRSLVVLAVLAILHFSIKGHAHPTIDEDDGCGISRRPVVENSKFLDRVQMCYGGTFDCPEPYKIPIGCWNTEFVADMSEAFRGVRNFNEPIRRWNVSRVTTMYSMFIGASSFNQPLEVWDGRKVTCMLSMF